MMPNAEMFIRSVVSAIARRPARTRNAETLPAMDAAGSALASAMTVRLDATMTQIARRETPAFEAEDVGLD